MGRNSLWPMRYGAREGVAVDLDARSLANARRNLAAYPELQVMRASAYELPFESRFDIVFSIGVVHHLEDPAAALRNMVRAAKPGGRVLIWVYGREGNEWLVSILDPLRKALFRHLPVGFVHHLSVYPAALLWLLLRAGLRPNQYFRLLRGFGFRHLRSIVFDQMLPRIAHYWRRDEVLSLMRAAGLEDVRVAQVNQMSWSAIGTRPGLSSD
jgi:SAM-dependent methyltransferase